MASHDNFMKQTCIHLHPSPHHSCENTKAYRITHLFFSEPWRCKVIVLLIKHLVSNGTTADIIASRITERLVVA